MPFTEDQKCVFYGYISTKDKKFEIEIVDHFEIGNIYCIEISSENDKVSVNAGLFVVNKKACDNGTCVPLIFATT